MHFSKLAAIIGAFSAIALATPAPDLPATAERAAPLITVCKNADYVDCMDIEVVLDSCGKFHPRKNKDSAGCCDSVLSCECTMYIYIYIYLKLTST